MFVLALTHTDGRLLSNRMTNKAGTPSAKNLERGVSSPSRDPSITPSHFSFLKTAAILSLIVERMDD